MCQKQKTILKNTCQGGDNRVAQDIVCEDSGTENQQLDRTSRLTDRDS